MSYLETARLRLRELTDSDLDDIVALHSDPEVIRYVGRVLPRDDLLAEALPHFASGLSRWVAELREDGEFVGWFGLRPWPAEESTVEVGYRLARAFWGQGLATEGCRALIAHAFTDLGARRVVAQTMAVNRASRRVMEKSGLRYVRTFHLQFDDPLPGTEEGEVEYGLDRAEFLES
jgi:RimJ/RimL family protein N-acetyltransferase